MNIKTNYSRQQTSKPEDGKSLLTAGLGEPSFGKQDVIKRRKNAIANINEARKLGMDRAVIEWEGYVLALDWVIGCMDA